MCNQTTIKSSFKTSSSKNFIYCNFFVKPDFNISTIKMSMSTFRENKIYRKKKYCERKLNLIETYIKLKIVLCCWKINVRGNYLISNFILSTNFTKYVELKSNQPPTTTSPPTCSKILNQPKHDSAISMPFIFFQTKELIWSSRFSTLN